MPILSRKSIHSERNCSTVNIPFLECSYHFVRGPYGASIEPTLIITTKSTGQPSFSLSALGPSYACVKPTLPCRSWSSDTGVVLCLYYRPYYACIGQPAVGCHYRRSIAPVVYTNVSTLLAFQEDHLTPFQKIFWADNSWFLHHDNAPPHTALVLRDHFAKNSSYIVPQSPYLPYLAPCDFCLYPKLKRPLRGHRFDTIEEI